MRFLHLYIHRHDYTRLVRARADANVIPVDPPEVICQGCDAPYYLDNGTADTDRRTERLLKREVRTRLCWECPDHPHWFDVEE